MTSTSALSVSYPPQYQDDVCDQPGIFKSFTTFAALFKPIPSTLSVVALKLYYSLFLLYIPFIYSSRAQSLLAEIKRTTEEHQCMIHHPTQSDPFSNAPPAANLTQTALDSAPTFPGHTWDVFRGSIINDCKLIIGVAATLLTALGSTIFQFANVTVNPASRTAAFVSMACAFVGAICAVMFTIHFRTTLDVLRGNTTERFIRAERHLYAWFNLWVLLALPLIWTAWSIITAIIFAMIFLWHMSPTTELPHSDVRCSAKYITPIAVTSVLSVGVLYLFLALRVLRSW